jgi:hypothetical protein
MQNHKEKRENKVIVVWLTVWLLPVIVSNVYGLFNGFDKDLPMMFLLGIPVLIGIFRLSVYLFNSFLLLFFRRKIKIDRLKGRVTPIYKVEEGYTSDSCRITKFEVQYTPLNLVWSVPFSVLFEEQEYIEVKTYTFDVKIDDVKDISKLWEEEHRKINLKKIAKISAKEIKERKIQKLNQTFLENYK